MASRRAVMFAAAVLSACVLFLAPAAPVDAEPGTEPEPSQEGAPAPGK